ncbi:MAG: tRNA-dihydrouridine synthase family protein [Oscillospiraceae bacterium]|nr:tRNA-dihydrouridine synthase family protein [Oscillospiraceae bacterium]
MQLSFAPMEGITTSVYRRIHAELFPGADRYYAPFLAPDSTGQVKLSALRDLLPEQNGGLVPVPQILCSRAEPFLILARELAAMGYGEADLNMGCPSGTVVPKHKGAGMLLDLQDLDRTLSEIFARCPLRVSVKTRLGLESPAEFSKICEILGRYPLSLLIVHARDRRGMYRSVPDLGAVRRALPQIRAPLCYNGNVFDLPSFEHVREALPGLAGMMLGRGAVADPALFRILRGGAPPEAGELRDFLDRLCASYRETGMQEHHVLGRMKEIWYYVNYMFPGAGRELKQLMKARDLTDYQAAVAGMFRSGRFDPAGRFPGEMPALDGRET